MGLEKILMRVERDLVYTLSTGDIAVKNDQLLGILLISKKGETHRLYSPARLPPNTTICNISPGNNRPIYIQFTEGAILVSKGIMFLDEESLPHPPRFLEKNTEKITHKMPRWVFEDDKVFFQAPGWPPIIWRRRKREGDYYVCQSLYAPEETTDINVHLNRTRIERYYVPESFLEV